jgi:hypothetical protein
MIFGEEKLGTLNKTEWYEVETSFQLYLSTNESGKESVNEEINE